MRLTWLFNDLIVLIWVCKVSIWWVSTGIKPDIKIEPPKSKSGFTANLLLLTEAWKFPWFNFPWASIVPPAIRTLPSPLIVIPSGVKLLIFPETVALPLTFPSVPCGKILLLGETIPVPINIFSTALIAIWFVWTVVWKLPLFKLPVALIIPGSTLRFPVKFPVRFSSKNSGDRLVISPDKFAWPLNWPLIDFTRGIFVLIRFNCSWSVIIPELAADKPKSSKGFIGNSSVSTNTWNPPFLTLPLASILPLAISIFPSILAVIPAKLKLFRFPDTVALPLIFPSLWLDNIELEVIRISEFLAILSKALKLSRLAIPFPCKLPLLTSPFRLIWPSARLTTPVPLPLILLIENLLVRPEKLTLPLRIPSNPDGKPKGCNDLLSKLIWLAVALNCQFSKLALPLILTVPPPMLTTVFLIFAWLLIISTVPLKG